MPGSTSARACAVKQPAADASAEAPRIRHVSADINVPLIHKDIPQRCLQQGTATKTAQRAFSFMHISFIKPIPRDKVRRARIKT